MYCSIDIETGGLSLETSLLQIAAVKWDADDIMECSSIDIIIKEPRLVVEPYAARMNAEIIDVIATGKDHRLMPKGDAFEVLSSWLGDERLFAVGKNAGTFDLPFLKEKGFDWTRHFKHRVLDAGNLYATPEGIPSLSEILETLPLPQSLATSGKLHHALWDARVTLYVAQCALKGTMVL